MAGGPILAYNRLPSFAVPIIAADEIFHWHFMLPRVLPSGTLRLRLWSRAESIVGSVPLTVAWALLAPGDNPDTVVLASEGITTISWATGDSQEYRQTLIPLDVSSLVAGVELSLDVTFHVLNRTLPKPSEWLLALVWED